MIDDKNHQIYETTSDELVRKRLLVKIDSEIMVAISGGRYIPEQCHPPTTRRVLRRAFYAGAEAMLRLIYAGTNKGVSEDAGVMMLEGWHDECRRFAHQVAQGSA